MPTGKRFTPEGNGLSEAEGTANEEPKTKSGTAKVTLVKPVQASDAQDTLNVNTAAESETTAGVQVSQPKRTTRPKVGRPAAARKKKDGEKDQKTEKKESRSRKKQEDSISAEKTENQESVKAAQDAVTDKTTVSTAQIKDVSVPDAMVAATAEPAPAEALGLGQITLEKLEMPADWNHEQHVRPQSFKSILFAVILFVIINLGFMTLFSASHKPKNLAAASAPVASSPLPLASSSLPAAGPAPSANAIPPIPEMSSAPPSIAPGVPPVFNASSLPAPEGGHSNTEKPAVNPASVSVSELPAPTSPVPEAASLPVPPSSPASSPSPKPQISSVTPAVTNTGMPAAGIDHAKGPSAQELLSILTKN